jgi:hypothetical protein
MSEDYTDREGAYPEADLRDALEPHSVLDSTADDGRETLETEPNYPTLYLDGERFGQPDLLEEIERLQIEFDATVNGYQSEAQERGPLGWCNMAAIVLDRAEDTVKLLISTGDPRGAFSLTVRRMDDGRLMMYAPHPSDSALHESLTEIRPGAYEVGA